MVPVSYSCSPLLKYQSHHFFPHVQPLWTVRLTVSSFMSSSCGSVFFICVLFLCTDSLTDSLICCGYELIVMQFFILPLLLWTLCPTVSLFMFGYYELSVTFLSFRFISSELSFHFLWSCSDLVNCQS
jgi:hypothetical protein